MRHLLYAAALAGAVALALPAHAALTLSQSTLSATIAQNFSGLPAIATSPQSAGGVTVSYVGTNSGIITNFLSPTDLSWDPAFGQGYTDTTFTGGPVDAFGFSAAQGNSANPNLNFILNVDVFSAGVLKASFSVSGLAFATLKDFSITGTSPADAFDEVTAAANLSAGHPATGLPDKLVLDRLRFDRSGLSFGPPLTAVPEPTTWAMMLIGFGGLGCVLRAKRSKIALA